MRRITLTRRTARAALGSLLATVAVVSGLALWVHVSAAPAAIGDCPSSTLCVWGSSDYLGTRWDFTSTGSWFSPAHGGQAESLFNNRSHTSYISDGTTSPPQANTIACLTPVGGGGAKEADLGAYTYPNGDTEFQNINQMKLSASTTSCS
jgi:hypothetical protein